MKYVHHFRLLSTTTPKSWGHQFDIYEKNSKRESQISRSSSHKFARHNTAEKFTQIIIISPDCLALELDNISFFFFLTFSESSCCASTEASCADLNTAKSHTRLTGRRCGMKNTCGNLSLMISTSSRESENETQYFFLPHFSAKLLFYYTFFSLLCD